MAVSSSVSPRTAILALGAGVAAFVVVGVLVTELATPAIEFSLFVGLPVGLVAAVATTAVVYARLGDPAPARRRPALALASFGAAFLLALVVATVVVGLRNSVALSIAAAVGLGVALGVLVHDRRGA